MEKPSSPTSDYERSETAAKWRDRRADGIDVTGDQKGPDAER
jgi:hypothetical protein